MTKTYSYKLSLKIIFLMIFIAITKRGKFIMTNLVNLKSMPDKFKFSFWEEKKQLPFSLTWKYKLRSHFLKATRGNYKANTISPLEQFAFFVIAANFHFWKCKIRCRHGWQFVKYTSPISIMLLFDIEQGTCHTVGQYGTEAMSLIGPKICYLVPSNIRKILTAKYI